MSILTFPASGRRSVFNNLVIWIPLVLILDIVILSIPFHLLIVKYNNDLQASKEIGFIIHGSIRIGIGILLIKKITLEKYVSFHPFKVVSFQYLLIPFLFPLILAIPNFSGVNVSDFLLPSVIVTCLSFVLMATAEEVLIRGLVLSALLKKSGDQQMIRAVMISSLLFSLMHLVNLVKMNFVEVLIQMIIAFYFGVFFGALMLKTKNLLYLGLIHGLVNIGFDIDTVVRKTSAKKFVDTWQEMLTAILTTSLVLSPLFIIGYVIIRKMQRQKIRQMAIAISEKDKDD